MGSGIATACVLAGIEVLLKEVNQKFLDVRLTCWMWWCYTCGMCLHATWKPLERVLARSPAVLLEHLLLCDYDCYVCIVLMLSLIPANCASHYLQAGLGRIQSNLTSRVKKGRMTESAAKAAMSLVQARTCVPLLHIARPLHKPQQFRRTQWPSKSLCNSFACFRAHWITPDLATWIWWLRRQLRT